LTRPATEVDQRGRPSVGGLTQRQRLRTIFEVGVTETIESGRNLPPVSLRDGTAQCSQQLLARGVWSIALPGARVGLSLRPRYGTPSH